MIRPEMANEPDRGRREQLDRAMWEATEEHLNPVYLDGVEIVQRELPSLGVQTYVELYERFGFRLKELAAQCEEFLADTEQLYEERLDAASRAVLGIPLDDLQRWDLQRLLRSPQWDEGFPGEQMVPALRATLADLGIDLDSQENIKLDIEQRPQKTPRAFCSPIEVPDKVMLVIQPIGGADDWRAFFHEAGHAEHFGNTSRDLAMEEKRLGDTAVTEGWAMLMQHLTDEPGWLSRKLDFPRPERVRGRGDALAALLRPPLLGEAALRARVPLRGRHQRDAEALRGAARRRAQVRDQRGQLPRRHRLRLLRDGLPALVGVRVPAARQPARALRQRLVRPARGRARCCASSGRSASSRPRTSC